MHPPMNVEHEAGQAASTISHDFGPTGIGIQLPESVA